MNKFARIMRDAGPARFFVPVGLVLIILGAVLLGLNSRYAETIGRVTAVTEGGYDAEQNRQQYSVGVAYTADGREYAGTFEDLPNAYKIGEEIRVFYDPEDPAKITDARMGAVVPIVLIGAGALSIAYGVYRTVGALQKSRALDKRNPEASFDGFRQRSGVREYYFRWDGNSFRPGYLIEDADRRPLFEGRMLKDAVAGARTFAFTDHITGKTAEHEVGHLVTQTYDGSFLGAKSWFRFDGENIWDLLHERGLRIRTDVRSRFPNMTYEASKDGAPFAQFESTSMYVHEDEEAAHRIAVPVGRMYYRCWTVSDDFETLFLTIFSVSESEQTMVE